jgi:hypothetical protein
MGWSPRQRLAVYARGLIAVYLFLGSYFVLAGTGLTDRLGQPLGRDFSHYWVAASLARAGDPSAVYDFPRFKAAQQAVFGPQAAIPWLYPPTFLLLMLPLALLPYLLSLGVWLATTLSGYLGTIRRLAPHPLTVWLTLAFPGTFQNLYFGQNGFLSAMLLGGGLLLVDGLPFAGGVLLGLLTYKPHLAVLLPVALVAGGRWRALLGLASSAAGLALASVLVLGSQVWLAFVRQLPWAMQLVKTDDLCWSHMPTVLAAIQLLGGGLDAALVLQGLVMLIGATVVAWVWFKGASLAVRAATLVTGTLLVTPYAFAYDLALLALPLVWLAWEGHTQGWLPGEKSFLSLAWVTPLIFPALAHFIRVPAAPLVLAGLLLLALRRGGFLRA